MDQDATIIESRKQEALRAYEGERGYQPMLAVWAEMNVVTEYYYRGDSASHRKALDQLAAGRRGGRGDS